MTNDQYDYIGAILGLCRDLTNSVAHFRAKIIVTIHDSDNENHLVEVKEFMELSINYVKLMDLRKDVVKQFEALIWLPAGITSISKLLGKTYNLSNINIINSINELDFDTLLSLSNYISNIKTQ